MLVCFARRAALPMLAAVIPSACEVPNFHGPQIQNPPPAFFTQDGASQQRRMFDHLDVVYHDAWVETSGGHFSGIFINGHAGALTVDDVYAAQDSARRYADQYVRFGEVEPITIDERKAWAWAEIRQGEAFGIDWIAYRAMIPYDTITYAVEFHGGEPGLKVKPDTLRTIVASFAIGETTWNYPLIALLFGALLLGVAVLRSRAQERRRRLQSIALKQIPRKEKKDGDDPAAPTFEAGSIAAAVAQAAGKEGDAQAGIEVDATIDSTSTPQAEKQAGPSGASANPPNPTPPREPDQAD